MIMRNGFHLRRASLGRVGRTQRPKRRTLSKQAEIPAPTSAQLQNYFITSSVPMLGFGFMDQTVMIQAGNIIDCSIGVYFGLSTLAAAALGQCVSAAAAALFGGTIDSLVRKLGLPRSGLTSAQRSLGRVKRVNIMGNFCGVVAGCILGLINFLFIDVELSSALKLQKFSDSFEIYATNELSNATTITVRGPDVHGLLFSITAALLMKGCEIRDVSARSIHDDGVDDVLVVSRDGKPLPTNELEGLCTALQDATAAPINIQNVLLQNQTLQETNKVLQDRIQELEHKQEK